MISLSKDKSKGGETFLCGVGQEPKQRAATADAHFTTLGFTSATGEPIMCAVIFKGTKLDPAWTLGLDPFAFVVLLKVEALLGSFLPKC